MNAQPGLDLRQATESAGERRESRIDPLLVIIVLVAACVRLVYSLPQHVAFGDESCYVMLAQNLFSGHGYTYYAGQPERHFPPLFPVVLGILNWVVRDWESVTRAAFVLFGSAMVVPVYLLGRNMYSKRIGQMAALFAALLPAYTSGILFGQTMGEPLFLFLLFMAIHQVHRASIEQRLSSYGLAGALFCLAYLTRPEALLYVASCFVYLAMHLVLRRPVSLRAAAARLLIYAALFLALASPYVVYLHRLTGEWALTTKDTTSYTTTRGLVDHDGERFQADTWGLDKNGEIKYFAHDDGPGLLTMLRGPYRDRVLDDIRTNMATAFSNVRKSRLFGYVLIFLSTLGLFGSPWRRERSWSEALNVCVIAPAGVFLLFFIADRFLYPMILPLTLWAAAGFDHILTWIERTEFPGILARPAGRTALKGLCIAVVAAYLVNRGWFFFSMKRAEQDEVWAAAAWLEQNTPEDAIVMTTGPEVAFHAGRRWLPVPYGTIPEIVEYGRKRNVDYLCIRGRYFMVRFRQRVELFYNAKDYEGLDLIQKEGKNPAQGAFVVYKLRKAGA